MDLIAQLKRDRRFYGTCPKCYEEFQLSRAVLFRIDERFPDKAIQKLEELKLWIGERRDDIKRQRMLARDRAAVTTEKVNIGEMLEQIAPSFSSFMYSPRDCRSLLKPIDYLIFPGLSKTNAVDSVVFADVKTGKARLSNTQKQIRNVVTVGKVLFRFNKRKG
jgi:predicted Holliday junction resolvase-like endonuclease